MTRYQRLSLLEMILTACEIIVACGGDRSHVILVLEHFANPEMRRRDKLFTSQILQIDLSLRAHTLLERLAGRKPTLETYWVDPPEPSSDLPPKKVEQLKRADNEKKDELRDFISPFVNIYDLRAQTFIGLVEPNDVNSHFQNAFAHYHQEEYRLSRRFLASAMKTRAAISFTRLMALPTLDRQFLFDCGRKLLGPHLNVFGSAEVQVYTNLALDHSLHQQTLTTISDQARSVKSMKASAEDKISALIRYARLILPLSYEDARILFNDTIEVASEVNVDSIHEIALFAPIAEHAVGVMDVNQRREVARNLAIVVSDAAIRLDGQENFPSSRQPKQSRTLTCVLHWQPQLAGKTLALLTAPLSYLHFWKQLSFLERCPQYRFRRSYPFWITLTPRQLSTLLREQVNRKPAST